MYLSVDGSISTSHITPSLADAQEFVGGTVELRVPQGDRECQMLMNEDGKIEGLPVNIKATMLWQHGPILGPVILLRGDCRWG